FCQIVHDVAKYSRAQPRTTSPPLVVATWPTVWAASSPGERWAEASGDHFAIGEILDKILWRSNPLLRLALRGRWGVLSKMRVFDRIPRRPGVAASSEAYLGPAVNLSNGLESDRTGVCALALPRTSLAPG